MKKNKAGKPTVKLIFDYEHEGIKEINSLMSGIGALQRLHPDINLTAEVKLLQKDIDEVAAKIAKNLSKTEINPPY